MYIKESYNWIRAYTIGTYFKIAPGSTKVMYQSDDEKGSGVWIG